MPELDLAWFKANIAESAEAGIMVPLHPEFGNKLVTEVERLRAENAELLRVMKRYAEYAEGGLLESEE